ncbi:hypothetical protein ACFE04_019506 [Oxalis oulophora]
MNINQFFANFSRWPKRRLASASARLNRLAIRSQRRLRPSHTYLLAVSLMVTEIYSFTQDDLMTEDIFILSCHTELFVWIGKQVDTKNRTHALAIGEKFVERDFLLEKISLEAPVYVIMEGSEPQFFTRFFTWDSAKSAMHGNSFQRKLSIVKNGATLPLENHAFLVFPTHAISGCSRQKTGASYEDFISYVSKWCDDGASLVGAVTTNRIESTSLTKFGEFRGHY